MDPLGSDPLLADRPMKPFPCNYPAIPPLSPTPDTIDVRSWLAEKIASFDVPLRVSSVRQLLLCGRSFLRHNFVPTIIITDIDI